MASSKVSLKLLVDKKGHRVLFAEAGKDFVDFLFSLLALPVGTVIRLLDNRNVEGGLAKLYKSLSDLNDDYIQSDQQKDALLKPKCTLPFSSPHAPLLSTEAVSTPSKTANAATSFYKCGYCNNNNTILSTSPGICPYCGRQMCAIGDGGYVLKSKVDAKGGGLVTYMVMDDLTVSPMSTISSVTLLNKFSINDLGALEEKVVHVGMNEGLELLKHSLNSKTVLTDVFLGEVVVKDETI